MAKEAMARQMQFNANGTTRQQTKTKYDEIIERLELLEEAVQDIHDQDFRIYAMTTGDVPYFESLNDINQESGVIDADTKVLLQYPQKQKDDYIFMVTWILDSEDGTLQKFWIPVRNSEMDENYVDSFSLW